MNEYIVNVPWESQNNVWWNDICATVIEHFGLPGNKYITNTSTEHMKFTFFNDKDALMCRLLISENI